MIATTKVIVFALVAITLGCDALKCNVCIGSANSDCAKGTNASMVVETCKGPRFPHGKHHHHHHQRTESNGTVDPPPPEAGANDTITTNASRRGMKFDTYCLTISTKGDDFRTASFKRSCEVIHHNMDVCKTLKDRVPAVNSCKSCNTDLCN